MGFVGGGVGGGGGGGRPPRPAGAGGAAAFGVRRDAVTLAAGTSSRTKIVDVVGADPAVLDRLLEL